MCRPILILLTALSLAHGIKKPFGCVDNTVSFQCNSRDNKWVDVTSIVPDEACGDTQPCTAERLAELETLFVENCANRSLCSFNSIQLGGSQKRCTAIANYVCIQGTATTPRVANTTPKPEDNWQTQFDSWQWVIIWIILAVVLVALIILIIMLINRCCYKYLNQEKPKFMETTPTQSQMGSALNSRSVSMSTLHRPTPTYKKDVTQEEIDEVRAQFGTNKKKKDKDKYFGQGVGSTIDSRRSSGDGAPSDANGKYFTGDDSSSGIGSSTYDSRLKNALYNDLDTCHDDYVSFTMKKQARSPLVNPNAYNTLNNTKRVDEELYKQEAPTVDIQEDRREENFRLDINKWDINRHQKPDQPANGSNSGVAVTIEHNPQNED